MKKNILFILSLLFLVSCGGEKKALPVMGDYKVFNVDVEELSGLCMSHDGSMLVSCGDQGVVKYITFDGQAAAFHEQFADMEGITLDPNTGDLYLALEWDQEVHRLQSPFYDKLEKVFAVQEAVDSSYRNNGLEAVEYYKDGILFVGSQENANLWQYRLDGTMISKISLADFTTEVAGLHYDAEADWLWVMDSNERKINICTVDGTFVTSYDIPFIENAESICVDRSHGCVWVGSDEDSPKLYRFDFRF